MRRAALAFARRGKPVFPCKPDKSPRTPNGYFDATTDPRKITAWWTRWPDALIGMPTGRASGFLVIDMDTYKAGSMTPKDLLDKFPGVSETATAKTGSGGLQLYFFCPEAEVRNSAGKIGPCVDVRGEGGYVILPPSRSSAGAYTWINSATPAPVPGKLLAALTEEPRGPDRASGDGRRGAFVDDGGAIPEGGRDDGLTRVAGRLHDGTRDLNQLTADLLDVNEARCIPPLPDAQVRKIAKSVFRYDRCSPPRRREDLAPIERGIRRRTWKGQAGKTRYSIAVAVLKLARRFGTSMDLGVEVSASARQIALAAGTSRATVLRNLKKMPDVLRAKPPEEAGKSGSIILLKPAPLDTTLYPQRGVVTTDQESRGGVSTGAASFSAPRLRWTSPGKRPRRGMTPGTRRVRDTVLGHRRETVRRLGKGCEQILDELEAAGGLLDLATLAERIGARRPRDLVRAGTVARRPGYVARLADAGVVVATSSGIELAEDWREALDRERELSGEINLYRRDMREYNRERDAYRNRYKVKHDPAPSEQDLRIYQESYPDRRRRDIAAALARLFRDHPEYRSRRVGQITCRLSFYLSPDFPRGPDGVPKDAEVELLLDGAVA